MPCRTGRMWRQKLSQRRPLPWKKPMLPKTWRIPRARRWSSFHIRTLLSHPPVIFLRRRSAQGRNGMVNPPGGARGYSQPSQDSQQFIWSQTFDDSGSRWRPDAYTIGPYCDAASERIVAGCGGNPRQRVNSLLRSRGTPLGKLSASRLPAARWWSTSGDRFGGREDQEAWSFC